MKALVKTQKGVGFIEVRDVPEPSPGAGEVKIEIAACGVCGSDIHVRHDTFPYWPPVILGHEFTGTIVELGSECRTAQLGQRVVREREDVEGVDSAIIAHPALKRRAAPYCPLMGKTTACTS